MRCITAPPAGIGYTERMSVLARTIRAPRSGRSALAAACLLACTVAGAQPSDRIDSTLPAASTPRPGDRVIDTRAQRSAGERRFRVELVRQAELDALFNPHRAADAGLLVPVPPYLAVPPGPPGPRPPGPRAPVRRGTSPADPFGTSSGSR